VISLHALGHRGVVHVLSRHGLTPLPHARPGRQQGDDDDLLAISLRQRMRWMRRRAQSFVDQGQPWQWAMDSVRHDTQALWQTLDVGAQRRFIRHAARYWDVHRHRIAPDVFARLAELRSAGRLRVQAARIGGMHREGDRIVVDFLARGTSSSQSIRVHHIINATGVEQNVARAGDALRTSLLARGIATPGPHAIGFATDSDGVLLPRSGVQGSGVFTLGSARIGELWESIAIPELRGQARRIARSIVDATG
jgi:uncharacterized NAD(P)/FAD-binding protein YdhS